MNLTCYVFFDYELALPSGIEVWLYTSFLIIHFQTSLLLVSDSFCASVHNIYVLLSKWTSLIYEASLFKSLLIFFKRLNGFLDTG